MIARERIAAVLDHPVYDASGSKIGDAKHLFLDDATGVPEWVSVKTGLFGSGESFVPIRDAEVVEDHLQVPFSKDQIKDAPNVDVDAGGHLSVEEEHRLYDHYGIDWDAAWQRVQQSGHGGSARVEPGAATDSDRDLSVTPSSDDAMTRSEEYLGVGIERRESGRARLRKYVVTEEQQMTVPVRHEEARVEREPITDANRDAALSGPDITEAEHEVVLHEERPVVETETRPMERVRLSAEERTEQETVHGRVRKERIDIEGADDSGSGTGGDDERRR
ncbi:DUF2382 domain-containing protein [Streptomyces sp. NPDC058864]